MVLADGLTDVPCMKLVKVNDGKSSTGNQKGTREIANRDC